MKKRIIVLVTDIFLWIATIVPAVFLLKHFAWFYHYGGQNMSGGKAPLHCGLRGILMSIDDTLVWGGAGIFLWTLIMVITVSLTVVMYVRISSNEPAKARMYDN